MGLCEKLEAAFGTRNSGLILDLAAYSIITENNAAQYYPDYAYNHPLFTPNMKAYSVRRYPTSCETSARISGRCF